MEGYKIKINQFEGPFDLLLFFIERDELDIYDIPISKITDDFLSYIRQLESLNIDIASEFILMAATLMKIKSRILLPRKEVNDDGQEIDPREELTKRLLEYKQYKDIIDDMKLLEEERSMKFDRSWHSSQLKEIAKNALLDVELESINLYKLMNTFHRLLQKHEDRQRNSTQEILKYPYTIETQSQYVLHRLRKKGKMEFSKLFEKLDNRVHAIVTFLALLELLNMQKLKLYQWEGYNNFTVEVL